VIFLDLAWSPFIILAALWVSFQMDQQEYGLTRPSNHFSLINSVRQRKLQGVPVIDRQHERQSRRLKEK